MTNDSKLKIYCVTNKRIKFLENSKCILAGVGKENFPSTYLQPTTKDNINFKELYYSELINCNYCVNFHQFETHLSHITRINTFSWVLKIPI